MGPKPAKTGVKTTVVLPEELWRAAKIKAMDERTDLRSVLIEALEKHLRQSLTAADKKAGGQR
jgi:hypothetical protein